MKKEKRQLKLTTKMLLGMGIGFLIGVVLQLLGLEKFSTTYIAPLGNIMINAIKMLVVPLIISSLITGITSLGDNFAKLGRVCVKGVAFFLVTMVFATFVGLFAIHIFPLGENLHLVTSEVLDKSAQTAYPNVMAIIEGFVPSNIVTAMGDANMLQCIFFCVLFAIACMKAGKRGEGILRGISNFAEIMYKMLTVIMIYAPIGIAALMANTIANFGFSVVIPLLGVIVIQFVCCALLFLVMYVPVIRFYCKIPLKVFFKHTWPPMLMAFSTGSSMASLSLNMEAGKKLGCSEGISNMLIIMGNTMDMAGASLYIGMAANFVAQAYGITLGFGAQCVVVIASVLLALGAVGLPGGAMLVLLASAFGQVGLPQAGVTLLAGIDAIGVMPRAWMNIVGDVVAALFVSKSEKALDVSIAMKGYEQATTE